MLARITLVFLPLCLLAQQPSAIAPPEVDRALRERVTQFFQAHVDGAFRKAYELVADDFKDFYFAGNKTRYKSFSIDSIRYFDNFTRAKVLLNTEVEWEMRLQKAVARVQTPASWKLQDEKWMWYDDPKDRKRTPMDPDTQAPGEIGLNPDGTVQLPDDLSPRAIADAASAQLKATTLDKSEVTLSSKASSDKVVLHNGAPGFVNLTLEKLPPIPGLTVELDKTQIGPNGNAIVKIACQPCTPTEPVTVNLTVEPFGRRFQVIVRIQ